MADSFAESDVNTVDVECPPIRKRCRTSSEGNADNCGPLFDSATKREAENAECKAKSGFEHLDHPADVQLHAWAETMKTAMEQLVVSMYSYMTDLDKVDEVFSYYFTATGRDVGTLMFSLLEEPLVAFQSEPFFIGKRVEVLEYDASNFSVSFRAFGESFDLAKHSQEADVKAITYSNMQIHQNDGRCDIYVIVDI